MLARLTILSLLPPGKWSPALQIRTVLLSVQALLSEPVPEDPLDHAIAELWKTDNKQAVKNGTQKSKVVHSQHSSPYLNPPA